MARYRKKPVEIEATQWHRHGDHAAVRSLLQRKVDVNIPQVGGTTALHWAVYRDDLESLGLLLAAGADIDPATAPAGVIASAGGCP